MTRQRDRRLCFLSPGPPPRSGFVLSDLSLLNDLLQNALLHMFDVCFDHRSLSPKRDRLDLALQSGHGILWPTHESLPIFTRVNGCATLYTSDCCVFGSLSGRVRSILPYCGPELAVAVYHLHTTSIPTYPRVRDFFEWNRADDVVEWGCVIIDAVTM